MSFHLTVEYESEISALKEGESEKYIKIEVSYEISNEP